MSLPKLNAIAKLHLTADGLRKDKSKPLPPELGNKKPVPSGMASNQGDTEQHPDMRDGLVGDDHGGAPKTKAKYKKAQKLKMPTEN